MKLVPYWRKAWKLTSLQLGAIGTAITSVFLAAPDAALAAWAILPEDIKSFLPPEVIKYSGVGILLLSFIARLIKQPKLEAANGPDRNSKQDSEV